MVRNESNSSLGFSASEIEWAITEGDAIEVGAQEAGAAPRARQNILTYKVFLVPLSAKSVTLLCILMKKHAMGCFQITEQFTVVRLKGMHVILFQSGRVA